MRIRICGILIAFFVAAFSAFAEDVDNVVVATDSLNVITTDIIPECEVPSDRSDVDNVVTADTVQAPLLTRDKDYWKKQLLKGKLDLNDETIQYPAFLQMCVNLYRWGDRTFNSYDSDYVVGTGYKCKVLVKSDQWLESHFMGFPRDLGIGMMSDVTSNLGGYVSYLAVSLGYSAEINDIFGSKSGKKRMEFQFTCALLAAEAYYSSNRGGTNIVHFSAIPLREWDVIPFSGINFESYGVDAYYFFNNKRYSQGAAYNFSKYQKKSAGSLIAGITASHQNIGVNFESLDDDLKQYLPEKDKMIYNFKYNDYCFLLGYGYNWVFKPNWVFNASIFPSIGYKHCFVDNVDGPGDIFSLNAKGRIGLVYNHNRFFYGLSAKFDGHWYKSEKYNFFNSNESLTLTAGFRFDIF